MKLLMFSDAAQTGFGRVGRELMARFLAAGVDVRMVAINWRGVDMELAAFMRTKPNRDQIVAYLDTVAADPAIARMVPAMTGGDGMGHSITASAITGTLFVDGWKPDTVLTVADPRAMNQRIQVAKREFDSVRSFNYVPIEGGDLPACWDAIWRRTIPIAMSEFGQAQLEQLLGRSVANIPHGVSSAFWKISPQRPITIDGKVFRTRDEAKAEFNLAGHFVILRTDRLVPRKNYPALFRTMAPVLAESPDRLLLVHCAPIDEGGVMAEFISHLPGAFDVNDVWRHPQIRFTGGHDTFRGYSDDYLALLYNAADIYVSPTKAEGFGLTLAEAAACGVPVVTTDYAAGPEAVGPGAVVVPPAAYMTNEQAHDWALVDEPAFTQATLALANDPQSREALGKAGIAWTSRLTWDATANAFLALMG